ncbi:MAG TPA: helix-turn-helix domain-containing protein, partial [Pyrinomonadaceae bacterium]
LPPLRERRADIPALVEHFLARYRERFNRPALALSEEARARLSAYDWPGNVRELRNTIERAAALSAGDVIQADQTVHAFARTRAPHESAATASASPSSTSHTSTSDIPSDGARPPVTLEELERTHILRVLSEAGGNRERAAVILGISARTLYRKLREYETNSANGRLATED